MPKRVDDQAPLPLSQAERFREVARELHCDDDEARFDVKLKKIAKAPKPKEDKPADPK